MGRASGSGADSTEMDPADGASVAVPGSFLLVAGAGQLTTYELGSEDVVIGRATDCDVSIDHRALSRRHALLRLGPPSTIQDLASTNGTRIAGRTYNGGDPIEFHPTEGFHIGPFAFVIVPRMTRAATGSGRDLLAVVDPTPSGVPTIVAEVAKSSVNVLVLGETGVGKEVLASTIHELSGRTGAFMRINCAALSETLLESELFGHEKGSFTGAMAQKLGLLEAACGGTVFLDELGELPLSIQAKLLRAVEHREVLRIGATRPVAIDVRFVAATNRDLPAEVAAGRFRRDLYFRIDGVTLAIPPLRERRRMIGTLALQFFEDAKRRGNKPDLRVGAEVLAALEAHAWPGNVREMKAVIDRAVLLAGNGDVAVHHLAFTRAVGPVLAAAAPRPVAAVAAIEAASPIDGGSLSDEQVTDRDRMLRALEECAGNQTRAAKRLGMSRTAFVTKMRVYRIPRPRS